MLSKKLGIAVILSAEQKEFIMYLTSDSNLSLLEGRAGSGKTTILDTVARSYEEVG
ncbi:MAG: AAA family ATPase [Rickettsiales endosymbiont of Dermacentor nuttalli]